MLFMALFMKKKKPRQKLIKILHKSKVGLNLTCSWTVCLCSQEPLGVDTAVLTLQHNRRPLRGERKELAALYSLDKAKSLHHERRSKKPTE